MGRGEDESISEAALRRLEAEVDSALRRRPPGEAKLAGALRVLAPKSPAVRALLAKAGMDLARRSAFERDLFHASVRALAESGDARVSPLLRAALASDAGGSAAALSAACFTQDPRLSEPLAQLAASRVTHVAFAAELARVVRGEANGTRLASLALKLKETYRIALCTDAFLPLSRKKLALPAALAPTLAVLCDAERHLGRWLVLAEIAVRIGDLGPLEVARAQSSDGPAGARTAWGLAAWALDPKIAAPSARPTMTLIARLSDRPSSLRDTAFLFRMAEAGLPTAVPMLEALAGRTPFEDVVALRAALHLARDYGRDSLCESLLTASPSLPEELRGLASAALFDLGETEAACRVAGSLSEGRLLASLAWSALVSAAAAGKIDSSAPILGEGTFRCLQLGWLEL